MRFRLPIFFIIGLLIITSVFADNLKYLIITHNDFYDAIQPLAQWKYKKGIITRIVSVPDGLSSGMIRDTIRKYQPDYVLLVGGRKFIPLGKYFADWVQSYPYLGTWTDQFYADTTDDDEYKDDIKLGRLPCTTAVQCSIMVNKIITYERKPSLNNDWFIKATGIARDNETNPHWDSCYRVAIREVQNILLNAGFNYVDTFFATYGATHDSVERVVKEGRGYVVYRGIALNSSDNWRTPFNVQPEDINNDSMPAIILSTTCRTMFFPDSFELPTAAGLRWLSSGTVDIPRGGAAHWGTTTHYYAGFDTVQVFWRNAAAIKFCQIIAEDSIHVLGEVIEKTKDSIFVCCSTYTAGLTNSAQACSVAYMEWNLLGDPELNLWTKIPQTLKAEHDTMIKPEPTNYPVLVTSNSLPVQHALVCVMMDSTIYYTGYTNDMGMITFSFTPLHSGNIQVTVVKPNYIPYEGLTKVLLRDVGITQILSPTIILDSTGSISPVVLMKNFGSHTENLDITLKIDTSYFKARTKLFDAGIEDTVYFPVWIPVRGTHSIRCSTYLVDDTNPSNNMISDSILVRVKDVGTVQIIAPGGTVDSGTVVIPQVKVKNYGTNLASFPVKLKIDTTFDELPLSSRKRLNHSSFVVNSGKVATTNIMKKGIIFDHNYEDTVWVSLEPNDSAILSFQPWAAIMPDTYYLTSYTMLSEEANPANDSVFGTSTVGLPMHDVGILRIIAPTGIIDSGTVVIPKADAKNFGTVTENFVIRFKIGNFYTDAVILTLGAGLSDTVEFSAWDAFQLGLHAVSCTTLLASDTNYSNNLVKDSVLVRRLASISEPSPNPALPKVLALNNNLPNPFYSQTIIRYSLPGDCRIKLEIYSASGVLVRTLSNGIKQAGFYRINWNGCDEKGGKVPKGIYFYRLQSGEFQKIRKMIKIE